MFDYFGIRDHSKYLVDGKEKTLHQALGICFNKVSKATMSQLAYTRFSASKKRFYKDGLSIEAIDGLFNYYGVVRLDNFKEPTEARQRKYNNFYRRTLPEPTEEVFRKYEYKDHNGIKYYRFLTVLC